MLSRGVVLAYLSLHRVRSARDPSVRWTYLSRIERVSDRRRSASSDRQAWQALGDLSRPEAMSGYIELLDAVCPAFRPFSEAHKCDREAKRRQQL